MDILAVASGAGRHAVELTAEGGAALFQINLFWVIVSALNFILFFIIIWSFAFKPVSKMLADRKDRIEQGLKDAEQARNDRENAEAERVATLGEARRERIEQGLRDAEQAKHDRETAEQERLATLAEARRESNDILARAQKVAQETRDADIAATREELERLRVKAAGEIEAEKTRAIQEVRGEVADLALLAAGKVLSETMTDERQRRLVDEFLRTSGPRWPIWPSSRPARSSARR